MADPKKTGHRSSNHANHGSSDTTHPQEDVVNLEPDTERDVDATSGQTSPIPTTDHNEIGPHSDQVEKKDADKFKFNKAHIPHNAAKPDQHLNKKDEGHKVENLEETIPVAGPSNLQESKPPQPPIHGKHWFLVRQAFLTKAASEYVYIDKFFEHRKQSALPTRPPDTEPEDPTINRENSEIHLPQTPPDIDPRPPLPQPRPESVSEESYDSFLDNLNFSTDESRQIEVADMASIRFNDETGNNSQEETEPKPQDRHDHDHHHIQHDPFSGIRHLLWFVTILGRFPFVIYPSKENPRGRISFRCRKKTKWWNKLDFYFITLLLGTTMLICSAGFVGIFMAEVKTAVDEHHRAEHYSNFEMLLFQKHWLTTLVFMLTLLIALVGNLTFLVKPEKVISFVNEVGQSFQTIGVDNPGGRWWKEFGFFHVFITLLDLLVMMSLVGSGVLGIKEGMQFETILYLRWFKDEVFINEPVMRVALWFVVLLEFYIYFLARNHLLFILILAKSITQSGHGWNSRIAHFLNRVGPKSKKNLTHLGKTLSYECLLEEHHTITKMVRGLSHAFPYTLLIFFGAKMMSICCILLRAAISFLFDLKVKHGSDTIQISETKKVKYDPTKEESLFQCVYYLSNTMIGLFVVSVVISQVGETVMNGFDPVRRYGLLLAPSSKGRKFIMSLFMSFNAKKPHVVKPGFWFYVDKGLFMSIVGTALFLFSIMIQCRISNLVEVPIVLSCPSNKDSLCAKLSYSYSQNEGNHQVVFEKGVKAAIKSYPSSPDLTTPHPNRERLLVQPTSTSPPNTTQPSTTELSTTTTTKPTSTSTTTTTKKPTTTTTTTTQKTTTTPKPPTPVGVITQEANLDVKMNACGLYCPNTRIYRMIPFKSISGGSVQSYLNDMVAAWNPSQRMQDCLVDPYKFTATNQISSLYDCFGRGPYKTPWDAFHHYGFTFLKSSYFVSREPDVVGHTSNTPFSPPNKVCYLEDSSTPGYNPLEVCAVPYPYVRNVYDHLNKGAGLKTLQLSKDDLFPSTLTKDPACKEPFPDPIKQAKLVVQFSYKGQTIYRMIPYGHVYVGAKPVPLDMAGKVWNKESGKFEDETPQEKAFRLFAHPYAYLHPHLTSGFSLGFHDCYGHLLKEFDDCGGLPFYVWDKATNAMIRPQMLLSKESGKRCYEDASNQGYECGVPPSLAKEACEEWAKFKEALKG